MASLIWYPADDSPLEVAQVTVDTVMLTFAPGVPKQVPTEYYAALLTALQGIMGTMAAPAAPTVATQGATGAATWGYKVAAVGQTGDTIPSTQGQATNGVTPLTGTNFQLITRPALPAHATGWRVIRTASGGTPVGVNVDISGIIPASTTTFSDTGIAGVAYTAAVAAPPVDLVVSGPPEL